MKHIIKFKNESIVKEIIPEIGLDLTKIYKHEDNLKKVEKYLSEKINK